MNKILLLCLLCVLSYADFNNKKYQRFIKEIDVMYSQPSKSSVVEFISNKRDKCRLTNFNLGMGYKPNFDLCLDSIDFERDVIDILWDSCKNKKSISSCEAIANLVMNKKIFEAINDIDLSVDPTEVKYLEKELKWIKVFFIVFVTIALFTFIVICIFVYYYVIDKRNRREKISDIT